MKEIYQLWQIANYDGTPSAVDLSYGKYHDINYVYREMERLNRYWARDPKSQWKFEIRDMS